MTATTKQSQPRLLTRAEVAPFMARSNAKGLRQLAGHLALLTATGTLVAIAQGPAWLVLAMAAHGVGLVFAFTALHEAIHRTAFGSRWLNDAVAWGAGFLVALPPNYFRAFHFAHHRYTQIRDHDPELVGKHVATWPGYLLHLSGWRYWAGNLAVLAAHAGGRVNHPFVKPTQHRHLIAEARLFAGLYLAIAIVSVYWGRTEALTYWIIPALLGQPALRAYLLAEHTDCPLVADMAQNSRTTLTLAPLRRLAWNMPFHTEHHLFPAVPFHALPGLHRAMADKLVNISPGYIAFHRRLAGTFGRE
ncbi:MAG: fatty acid desaturase [Hyphomicrobiales bacterium]